MSRRLRVLKSRLFLRFRIKRMVLRAKMLALLCSMDDFCLPRPKKVLTVRIIRVNRDEVRKMLK